jgi:hypothetical protein
VNRRRSWSWFDKLTMIVGTILGLSKDDPELIEGYILSLWKEQ